MAEEAGVVVASEALDMVLGGAPDELVAQVMEAIATYAQPSKGPQEEVVRAGKLRGAFGNVVDWILGKRLPNLNDAQWLFLSTGAIGSKVTVDKPGGGTVTVELVPESVFNYLVKARQAKAGRPGWSRTILDVEDKIQAMARGEMVGLDSTGTTRRKKPQKPLGADQLKEKVRERLAGLASGMKDAVHSVESQLAAWALLRDEKFFANAKLNVEALKKYAQLVALPGTRTAQEQKLIDSVGDKVPAIAQSIASLGGQLERTGAELANRVQAVEGRANELRAAKEELDRLGSGATADLEAAYDVETVAMIRRDSDSINAFASKGAENAENKVSYSGARILLRNQWEDTGGKPEEVLCTLPAVLAAIEKISKFHINVFPKDSDGHFIVPPICIEPVRNYVEFFDDRIVMSLVSGEATKRGPKVTLSPIEVQVLKACGQWLCKDPLYDYRGEINAGTFIGDYSGKVEKKTSVKWAGDDKKFTMASSSQVVDGATRGEAVTDYCETIFAMANGTQPPQKLSRRKIAVILRYCTVESIERTVALILLHTAQAEPMEAKESILKHCKNETEARAAVTKAFEDPQIARILGDREFFLTKLFGKAA